jgi:UDP:flavonoid glycosyltransferase YjiC (YdhE family)
MNALILTLGTRGDLELFLLLARTLRDRGHHVHVVTSHFHAHRVRAAGISCSPVGAADPALLDALLASFVFMPDLRARTRAYVEQFLRPQLALAKPALESLTAHSDYFVSNLKITVARNGIILPTAFVTYDPPAAIDELDRYSATLPWERILELVAFPRPFADPDSRWPARFRFTNFWMDPAPPPPLPASVQQFLAAGAPPIVMTTGSMRMFDPAHLIEVFAGALEHGGHRGIVLGIPQGSHAHRPNLLYAEELPYGSLFHAAACVIHHGGVGAVAQTLRAGKPSIVLPQILAQRHMADLLERHMLSAGTFDPAAISADSLAAAIITATCDSRYTKSAQAWRAILEKIPGVSAAAAEIERHCGTIIAT